MHIGIFVNDAIKKLKGNGIIKSVSYLNILNDDFLKVYDTA